MKEIQKVYQKKHKRLKRLCFFRTAFNSTSNHLRISNAVVDDVSFSSSALNLYLFVFASFLNTPHVFFQVAAFYQLWQASVFHDTSSQLLELCYPIDIFPLCSPTFLVLKENPFNKYSIPYFNESNLSTLFYVCRKGSKCTIRFFKKS